jgi:hypothetical protein
MEPVVAESLAALRAAEFSRNRGLERLIILEGDSLLVVCPQQIWLNVKNAWATCCRHQRGSPVFSILEWLSY